MENKDALPSDARLTQAKDYFNEHPTEDAGALSQLCWQKPVCSIGERHSSIASKELMAQSIESLAGQGYTTIGLEMVKQRDQGLLDAYMAGRGSKGTLLDKDRFGAHDYAAGGPEKYVSILDSMRAYNFCNLKKLKPLALEIDYDVTKNEMTRRDVAWAKLIDAELKQHPESKIVTYTGLGHLGLGKPWSTLTEELTKLGHQSSSINLDATSPGDSLVNNSRIAAAAAGDVGAKRSFSYPIAPARNGELRANFGVFIPWIEPRLEEPGKDVTAPSERGISRTGELAMTDTDKDGKLYATTNMTGELTKLEYRGGGHIDTIYPPQAEEMADVRGSGWIYFKHGTEGSLRLLRNRSFIAVVQTEHGKLKQIRGNPTLIYPDLR